MDKRGIIKKKYELATDKNVQETLNYLLEYVVDASTSALSSEKLQGMLILLNEPKNWINTYNKELEKAKKENS